MMNRLLVYGAIFKICARMSNENAGALRGYLPSMIDGKKKNTGMVVLDSIVAWGVMIDVLVIRVTAPATKMMLCKKIHFHTFHGLVFCGWKKLPGNRNVQWIF